MITVSAMWPFPAMEFEEDIPALRLIATFKGEKVLRVGSEKDYTGHDILVDLTSDEFNYNCLAKRRLDKQLEDQK